MLYLLLTCLLAADMLELLLQDAPNAFPFLPPPSRVQFLDLIARPDRMLYELLGPELCFKVTVLVGIFTLVFGLVQTMPLIVTQVWSTSTITSGIQGKISSSSPAPLLPPPPPPPPRTTPPPRRQTSASQ